MAPVSHILVTGFTVLISLLGLVSASSSAHHDYQHAHRNPSAQLTTWEQIHQVIHAYALAIDFKDFDSLAEVFSADAFANYTGPLSSLQGLTAIQQGLDASVARVDTQHQLSTTVIDLSRVQLSHSGARMGSVANSTTYFQASLFGKGDLHGEVLYMYGLYQDELVQTVHGWRIRKRQLVFQGPMIGNMKIIQP